MPRSRCQPRRNSRGEESNSAAKALTAISRDIKDVPPELITELVDKEFNRDMGLKAPKQKVPKEIVAAERAAQRQRIMAMKKERQDTRMDSVTIPEGVKTVGTYAFGKCGELKSVSIPSSVTVIGNASFCYCSKLESVTIPKNVVSIWDFAFIGCSGLKSIEIPDYVRNIGKRAFYECTGLTSVTVRGERSDVKEEVFGGCANLKSIHVSANAKSWAGMTEWQGIPLVFDGK